MEYGEYRKTVMYGLQSLPVGQIVEMESSVNPKNRDLFIEVVKGLIDEGFGNDQGWIMELNSQYTRYRKILTNLPLCRQNTITLDIAKASQ